MTTDTRSFEQRFAANLQVKLRSGSTYVVAGLLVVLGVIAAWPDLDKAIDMLPGLHGLGVPIAGLVVALFTMLKPSNALSPQTQALMAEIARLKMNEYLRAHGAPEIPAPPASTALPPLPIVVPPLPPAAPVPAPADPPPPPAEPAARAAPPTMPPSLAAMADPDAIAALLEIEPLATDDGRTLALKVLRLNRRAVDFDPTKGSKAR